MTTGLGWRVSRIVALFLIPLLVASACASGDGTSESVGPRGGQIGGPGGVRLVVPAGVLAADSAVRIANTEGPQTGLEDAVPLGSPVLVEIDGTLSGDVTIEIPFDPSDVPASAGTTPDVFLARFEEPGGWVRYPGGFDLGRGVAWAVTRELSTWQVFVAVPGASTVSPMRAVLRAEMVSGARTGISSPVAHSALYPNDDGIQWDIYGDPGAEVFPAFYSTHGEVTLSVTDDGSTCGPNNLTAGRTARVAVHVNGQTVGVVRFGHLVSVNTSATSPDHSIGRLPPSTAEQPTGWPSTPRCWEVTVPGGIHTHLDINFGCYATLGTSVPVIGTTPLAMVGKDFDNGDPTPCDPTQLTLENSEPQSPIPTLADEPAGFSDQFRTTFIAGRSEMLPEGFLECLLDHFEGLMSQEDFEQNLNTTSGNDWFWNEFYGVEREGGACYCVGVGPLAECQQDGTTGSSVFGWSTSTVENTAGPLIAYEAEGYRVGDHAGFVRVVFDLYAETGQLWYRVGYVDVPFVYCTEYPFTDPADCDADLLTIEGSAALSVAIASASENGFYGVIEDAVFPPIDQILWVGNLGVGVDPSNRWVIGLSGRRPFNVEMLQNPLRLVIDIEK